jgi:hypothetical protein
VEKAGEYLRTIMNKSKTVDKDVGNPEEKTRICGAKHGKTAPGWCSLVGKHVNKPVAIPV